MDINVTAPINSLGYGIVGLNVVAGLDRLGHRPALWPIGEVEAPEEQHEMLRRAIAQKDLFDSRAPSLRISIQSDLAQHVGRGPHCGLPIFELNRFNALEKRHLDAQDLLFVPSKWAKRVLVDNGIPEARIHIARFGVDHDIFRLTERIEPGATVFLNVGKWEVRKGHDVLAEAFNSAFTRRDDVRLILLTPNPFHAEGESREWADVYRTSSLGDKIEVIEERLPTQRGVAELMARADCGVFPYRAEGWNLDLAEMMAMAKNVIATNYSAPTEYLTPANARLIEIERLVEAGDGKWFYGQGEWADFGDAQVEQLVAHMREVHRLKQSGELRPNIAGHRTMAEFSWDATARCIAAALAA
ncbi:MAG: glycosyltransferase family 4 protein [Betaproteobacteria bacterium]|nr:glycosyltransferase family 4 protein [Betaproteobacteria bacterium]